MHMQTIPFNLPKLRNTLDEFRRHSVDSLNTADLITACNGTYTVDIGTPPPYSKNAAFGKLLKKHAFQLGLAELKAKQHYISIDGRKTSCSIWRIIGPRQNTVLALGRNMLP